MKKYCIIFISLLLFSCASIVSTKNDPVIIPEAMEMQFGLSARQEFEKQYKKSTNTEVANYVSKIGNKLVASLPEKYKGTKFEFILLDSSEVNAFAIPGGYVYITTGLMKELQDEAQLATVLGHEMGHVLKKHTVKALQRQIIASKGVEFLDNLINSGKPEDQKNEMLSLGSSIGVSLLLLKNSRENEFEADEMGSLIASYAGYSPNGTIEVQNIFLKLRQNKPGMVEQMLSTHPVSEERIKHAEDFITQNSLTGSITNMDNYVKIKKKI
ncbi:MAG: M48 family metalloprotease [Candidatus Goldbacteria bacterium]|nr:M48 family metalloprotease [Candidatus Goldiibacteriota bacterium]